MALGDGVTWAEALPDNNTVAHQIDDYNRDLRVGVRARMAREHIWAAAQTATNEGGHHNFITLQAQTAPTMAGTTGGCIYVATSSAGYLLRFINSAGADSALPIASGTQGAIPICSSANAGALTILVASAPGMTLHTKTGTAAPTWEKVDLSDSLQVTGTGFAGFKVFSSTWTQITANGTDVSFTHNLALTDMTKIITTVWLAQDATGGAARSAAVAAGTSYGLSVMSIATNTCVIQVGGNGVAFLDDNGTITLQSATADFDFCRINILALI